ncbi:hypothetical protein EJ08DRAFT_695645 [Tothia fuscella]|uniref:Uncharacterized protein n=1 Tax=Tothia fuscella TaxID=1048955 RepID=A0A9P4NUY5_9PEZI|nr:hypothetical protein EJ08DRAFT_695645 [Tothia fuscella]
MVSKIIAVVAALAVSALAAPTDVSKPFKIGVTIEGKTVYLTKTATASPNLADGISCTIGDKPTAKGAITCEGNLGYYYADRHPFDGAAVPITLEAAEKVEKSNKLFFDGYVKSNSGWSIGAGDVLTWKAQQPGTATKPNLVHLSRSATGKAGEIYAEICSTYGHPDGKAFTPGAVKAYYV